jgi:hypothetical protein
MELILFFREDKLELGLQFLLSYKTESELELMKF